MGNSPVLVTQLVNCLGLGGTERQLVEHLRRLDPGFSADVCCLNKVGEYLPVVRSLGYEPEEFHLRGSLFRPNTLHQIQRLAERLRKTGARVLHCHDFYSNLIGTAAARVAGIPYIVSRRDQGAWLDWKRMQALKHVTRTAPRVLANAYAIRDQLSNDEGLSAGRVTVVHNGLDLGRFDKESARPPDGPQWLPEQHHPAIAVVANMKHAVKGHAELIDAAAIVVQNVPEARFLLVGDGALRPALERQARRLGIESAVLFMGKRTDVPALLRTCRIGVCASHSEGLSNAIMESMAASQPVVATAVGGNVELVRDGQTGFLVPPADPEPLASRLVALLQDTKRARSMGVAGRRRIETEFSADACAARMSSVYAELLGMKTELRHAA